MKQIALLERSYLANILDTFIISKYRELHYHVERSITTNSTYLRLTYRKGITVNLRISDHYSNQKHMKQFIICPNKKLTVSKRKLFIKTILNSIKYAQRISVYKYMGETNAGEITRTE
ncbi:MAG: hypothetical protein RR342_01440 [Bacilli bacterium]